MTKHDPIPAAITGVILSVGTSILNLTGCFYRDPGPRCIISVHTMPGQRPH